MSTSARQVLPDRHLHRRQPPARAETERSRAGEHGAHQLAQLRTPRLPGLRRGARCALCHRCRDARHRQPADRRQRHRLPRGVLDALPGDLLADPLDSFAVRQCRGGGDRDRRGAARCKGRDDVRVVAQGGDGGTTDIGFGCLSGMFERNDDVLYICYDNEAYMNTGVQRSSATPPAARTATTMAVGPDAGQRVRPGQERAADRHGARDPLRGHRVGRRSARPRGQGDARRWRSAARATSTSSCPARSAGARRRTTRSSWRGWRRRPACSRCSRRSTARSPAVAKIRRQVPVEEYLKPQKRFAHLFKPELADRARSPRLQADGRPQHPPLRPAATEEHAMKKPFAITLDVGSSLANQTGSWRTERPVYVDRLPPCNARLSGRREHPGAGCSTPRRATTRRPGAC